MAPPPEVSSLSISERLIKGEFAVRSAIRSVLIYEISHTENAEFNLFLPTSLKLTIDFMEFWLDNRNFTVNELLCFETSPNAAAKNLELLHAVSHCVLPLVVTTNLTIFMRRQRRHRSLQWDTTLFLRII